MKKIIFIFMIFSIIYFVDVKNVYADDIENDEILESIEAYSGVLEENLEINSKHSIVIDRKTKIVLYEKDAYSEVKMASTTKIMTCLVVLENCNLNDIVKISKNASNVNGSQLNLKMNDNISVNDLLYGLMLRSGNDCAVALAEHISGSVENFALLMNEKAKLLGLNHTNFVTPHGLDDDNHYTNAYELAILTDYALNNEKFRQIVGTKTANIRINNNVTIISNTNELLGSIEGVYGVKTGFTFGAGRCLVSSCKRNNMDIIVIVLGADTKKNRTVDSIKIINYIYSNYGYVDIKNYIEKEMEKYNKYYKTNVNLIKTITTPEIYIDENQNFEIPLNLNKINTLKSKFFGIYNLSYELIPNTKVANLQVYYEDKIVYSSDVLLKNKLVKNDWKYYFKEIIKIVGLK